MKKHIILIRHGKTQGNLQGRYIGKNTDEDLCEQGTSLLMSLKTEYKKLTEEGFLIYTSPMKRAISTSEILFPGMMAVKVDSLTEIDFGDFENKNYMELNGNEEYQKWIDSGGRADYPGGEKLDAFIDRSAEGFKSVLEDMDKLRKDEAVIVCHGGNIMAIMSVLTGEEYFDFQIENGSGFDIYVNQEEKDVKLISYNRIQHGISS